MMLWYLQIQTNVGTTFLIVQARRLFLKLLTHIESKENAVYCREFLMGRFSSILMWKLRCYRHVRPILGEMTLYCILTWWCHSTHPNITGTYPIYLWRCNNWIDLLSGPSYILCWCYPWAPHLVQCRPLWVRFSLSNLIHLTLYHIYAKLNK